MSKPKPAMTRRVQRGSIALLIMGVTYIFVFTAYNVAMIVNAWLGDYLLFRLTTMLLNTLAAVSFYLAWRVMPKPSWKRPVRLAPGTYLERIARFVWPPRTVERVFAQTIADMRLEYQGALHKGDAWHSRWIWVRGHINFWAPFAGCLRDSLQHFWRAAK